MKIPPQNFAALNLVAITLITAGVAGLSGCGNSNSSSTGDDTNASAAAAGAAGGALSGSNSSGTLALFDMPGKSSLLASAQSALNPFTNAYAADTFCPTFRTTGTGCADSGDSMWLSYSDCSFLGINTWNGVQEITSTVATTCGSFPTPSANGSITRQIVAQSGASTPGTATITTQAGVTGVIDDASTNLANYDGDTISTIANGGYGSKVSFGSNDARNSITVAHRVYVTGSFDHSVTGTLTVSEPAGATSRTLSGSLTVYHNLLKIKGNSVFNNVVHQDSCCFPTSGSISTTFTEGNVAATSAGSAYIGKTESLTFTGCKTATFVDVSGNTSSITMNRCF